jgi:hypothetical protein
MFYEQFSPETYLFNAANFLERIGEIEAARLLAICQFTMFSDNRDRLCVNLKGTASFYNKYLQDEIIEYDDLGEELTRYDGSFRAAIKKAFEAIFPDEDIQFSVGLIVEEYDHNWRGRMLMKVDTTQMATDQNKEGLGDTLASTTVVSNTAKPNWNTHKVADLYWLAAEIITTIGITGKGSEQDIKQGLSQIHWHIQELDFGGVIQRDIEGLIMGIQMDVETELDIDYRDYIATELQTLLSTIARIVETADPTFTPSPPPY